ncbi:MAG: toll/interleukin-1 receptor domain-containing protein, partial [Candidatus Didemnitutus sp.]|nr:toll/interleukin-1 receptor domain-containing protein [Candidatus Didemnitutus sp.]
MSDATKAVFLSYAHDDAAAARRIADALRSAGIEVWFDENELRGGDSWDAKIRQQIDACALFLPIISASTQERSKGYFRLEWKLAVDQTHLLAAGVPFVAPVVVDGTAENAAIVPTEFMRVQWTRLPGGLPTPQ